MKYLFLAMSFFLMCSASLLLGQVEVFPLSLDFGGETSPVAVPYTQLAASDVYDSQTGYGWQIAVSSGDRGTVGPSTLDRDFNRNIGGVGTFLIDVPNGAYDLSFRFWEQYTQGPFDVVAEGNIIIDDLTVNGNAGPTIIDVNDVVTVSDGQLTIAFPTITANWMINGLTIKPSSMLLFDFEQLSSATMLGWQKVTKDDVYNAAAGYGWDRVVDHTDRGTGDWLDSDLCRDLTGTAATFNVDLDNGRYIIELTIGDRYANSGIDVFAEGVQIADNLSYSDGQFLTIVQRVTISDGQLNLQLVNDSGAAWVINNLIIRTPPANCGLSGTEYLVADLNQDCYVNLQDFAMIAGQWLNCTDPANVNCFQYWW